MSGSRVSSLSDSNTDFVCVYVCVSQTPVPGRVLCTETVSSGSPVSAPDVPAAGVRSSVQ